MTHSTGHLTLHPVKRLPVKHLLSPSQVLSQRTSHLLAKSPTKPKSLGLWYPKLICKKDFFRSGIVYVLFVAGLLIKHRPPKLCTMSVLSVDFMISCSFFYLNYMIDSCLHTTYSFISMFWIIRWNSTLTCPCVVSVVVVVLREVFICMCIASYTILREWACFLAIIGFGRFWRYDNMLVTPLIFKIGHCPSVYVDDGLSLEAFAR